jgi:hypothetical protein
MSNKEKVRGFLIDTIATARSGDEEEAGKEALYALDQLKDAKKE